MFPEIRDRLSRLFGRFSAEPVRLNIETPSSKSAEWYARNGYNGIYSLVGTGPSWSGEAVNVNTALNHSVVYVCTSRISGAVGFMPLQMMQERSGEKRLAKEHPMYAGLNDAPNDEMTAMDFRSSQQVHLLLQGNAYAQIIRRSGSGTAVELIPLDPLQVHTDREKTGQHRLVYVVGGNTYTVERNKPQDILDVRGLSWDGLRGYSVIEKGRHSIGTAISAQRHVARFYAGGGRLPYVLNLERDWKDPENDGAKFRSGWNAIYSDPAQAPIIPPWLKYQSIGVSARDAQTLEMLEQTPADICRWFEMSPHLAGDLTRATNNNIDQLAREFVDFTLHRWVVAWEKALKRCVLTPDEKSQGYYFKHNVNALLRGDFKTRMEGYASALQNGHLSVDEVRDLEDRNPLPDGAGADHHIQLNMQALPAGDPQSAQPAQLVKLGAKKNKSTNGHAAEYGAAEEVFSAWFDGDQPRPYLN